MVEQDENQTSLPDEPVKVEKKERMESPLLSDKEGGSEVHKTEQIVVVKKSFWEKFKIFRLSVEEKAVIAENIISDIKNTPLYWLLIVISVTIATFGLLQNSAPIIIGAMLIAPLLNPIKGLAFGITTGQQKIFWKAVFMLVISIIVAISTAYIFSLMIPLKVETSEIIARTSPNLLDLLIAIAAGTVAILSLYFKKLSENLAGVAMAASILPPLAIVGIELALFNKTAAFGSFFLFVTNFFAILFVGVVFFLLFGFLPTQEDVKNKTVKVAVTVFILLMFISFPLYSSMTRIADRINFQAHASGVLKASLLENFPQARLANIDLIGFDEENAEFSGTLELLSGAEFDYESRSKVLSDFEEELDRNVNMELKIISIISF